jgi:hypothetical protein
MKLHAPNKVVFRKHSQQQTSGVPPFSDSGKCNTSILQIIVDFAHKGCFECDILKKSSGDPTRGRHGRCCMPHPHTWGPELCWPSEGNCDENVIKRTGEITVQFVSWQYGQFFFLFLQQHPECKKKLIRSLNHTAEENKAHVQEVKDHYFRKEDLNLIKARSERHRENIYDIQYGHPWCTVDGSLETEEFSLKRGRK